MERTLLVAITFAFFGAGMVTLATASRLFFAMARGARLPAHGRRRRVDPRTHTPVPATILMVVVGGVLMVGLPGGALLELITAGTIIGPILYGAIVVLYLSVRRRLDRKEGAFDLGRFELPVAIGALVWSIIVVFVVVTPPSAIVPIVIVVGLMLTGGLYFLSVLFFRRDVLATEPGEVNVFQH
jgi:amino acid transporter